jgi:CO/xanthine dehydrogenase FAD-binding subunit
MVSKGNERTVKLADFYTADGIMPFAMEPHELLKKIILPKTFTTSAYQRLAYRSAIDYPIVCAAVSLRTSGTTIDDARVVVGAMGRSPLYFAQASSILKGKEIIDTDAFHASAVQAMNSAEAFAVHNAGSTLEYRITMVEQMVFRALEKAAQPGIV